MGNRIGPRFPRNFHEALQSADALSKWLQILALVNCVASEHRKDMDQTQTLPEGPI